MQQHLLATLLLAALCGGAQAETIFRRSNDAEPASMDPQLARGMPEMHILRDMFVGLVDEDAGARPIPGAAASWDVSSDGKTWTFHLREANWSDGKPVTADDFVYAWRRAVDPETGSKYAFGRRVKKNDPSRFLN